MSNSRPAPDPPHLWFHGGTLVLEGYDETADVPQPFRWVKAKWRCPALHYPRLVPWLRRHGIQNRVPRWQRLDLTCQDDRIPHDYQTEALAAWQKAGQRGSIVLPTGAGKTFVAVRAIASVERSALVIAPTIDLLHQWYATLTDAFNPSTSSGQAPSIDSEQGPSTGSGQSVEIGVYYGQEKELRPITVTTYHSASSYIGEWGNTFKFLIFDEVHHLPAPSWQEIGLMSAAPYRMGLTATYPEDFGPLFKLQSEDPLQELIGPVVYEKAIDDLTGKQLAEYRTERIRVDLTPAEREAYDQLYAEYVGYMHEKKLRESHGPYWWHEYTRRSAYDPDARRAKVAERELRELIANAEAKLRKLEALLKQHADERVLVFTEQNSLAYDISRRYLVPAITHQTTAKERKAILDGFRDGTYRAIVTSKVLNEGVDLPEAKVAVVLGGSSSAREYVQRLGRILRKRENKTAVLYEVIVRGTIEEGIARRRARKVGE